MSQLAAEIEAAFDQAIALQRRGQFDAALRLHQQVLQWQPKNAAAHNNYANVLCRLNRHAEAIPSYDRAIALSPHDAQAYYHRGLALMKLEQHEAAVESFDKALTLKPDVGFFGWHAQ